MIEPIGTIKIKSSSGPEEVSNSNALTTKKSPDKNANPQELLHLTKSKNTSMIEEVSQEKIDRIAKAMDNYIRSTDKDLQIKVHSETGQIMITVISGTDGKVIREIPSEEVLNLAAKIDEMTGVLFNKRT